MALGSGCGEAPTAAIDAGPARDAASTEDGAVEDASDRDAAVTPDAALGGDGSSPADGGPRIDAGEAFYPDTCPPWETIVCTEPGAWCDAEGRAFVCFESLSLGLIGGCVQCAPFGSCRTLGDGAYCHVSDETCGPDYEAHCEGNVALTCRGSVIAALFCDSAADCWARGPFAGCGRIEGCIRSGGECGSGSGGRACCEGFCDFEWRKCVLPEGASCDARLDLCAPGTRCLPDEDGAHACRPPTCHRAPTETDVGDDCGRWPEPLPCCDVEMTCALSEDGSGRCCLPGGAPAVSGGVNREDQCCHGVTYEFGVPYCADPD